MVVLLILVLSSVMLVSAKITGIPKDGACFCVSGVNVNARDEAGLTSNVIASVSKGECYTYNGDNSVTKDGYEWFLITHHRKEVWIAGNYLRAVSKPHCAGEYEYRWQACAVIASVEGGLLLAVLIAGLVALFRMWRKRLNYHNPGTELPLVRG